jgi:BlaI family transcriptional regulator, penicillinase repressor
MSLKKRKRVEWETLGAREREILEVLLARTEATAAEVLAGLKNPPSYSSVRGMLALLEQKRYVQHRRDGLRYVYASTVSAASARGGAIQRLLDTFFDGSPARAVAALLELPDDAADETTMSELRSAVLAARKAGR